MSKDLNERQNFLLGISAAFIEGLILQPTLYWKNAMAQNLPFTLDPRKLYRGTAISILNECQMMGLQFFMTGWFHSFFQARSQVTDGKGSYVLSQSEEVLSSLGGGGVVAFTTAPMELVMIHQQKYGGSIYTNLKNVVGTHGFGNSGLYRALLPTVMRDATYVCGMLAITPIVQKYLTSPESGFNLTQPVASLCASLIGGLVGALPSHPLDVCKTVMQADLKNKASFTQTVAALMKEGGGGIGGIRRLYNGCFFRTLNITGTVYIANECNNRLAHYFAALKV